jgi:hypothetical protein
MGCATRPNDESGVVGHEAFARVPILKTKAFHRRVRRGTAAKFAEKAKIEYLYYFCGETGPLVAVFAGGRAASGWVAAAGRCSVCFIN